MIGDLLNRLERAADAFLAPAPTGPPPQGAVTAMSPGPRFPLLDEEAKAVLQDQALGLLDSDLRGWMIVTVRDGYGGAEIDVVWRMPDAAWPAVGACLVESVG